jgi:hypothetical protein
MVLREPNQNADVSHNLAFASDTDISTDFPPPPQDQKKKLATLYLQQSAKYHKLGFNPHIFSILEASVNDPHPCQSDCIERYPKSIAKSPIDATT